MHCDLANKFNSEPFFWKFLGSGPVKPASTDKGMPSKSPRQQIFGTDDEESSSSGDEDKNPSDSVKPGRGAPKKDTRIRLSLQQMMEAMQHFDAKKGMSQAALIDWCFHKF